MKGDILNQVQEVIAEALELDAEDVLANSSLVDELEADSLDIVDLSFSLGKHFDIEMPKKSVIMHAEEKLGGLSDLVVSNKLTRMGALLLQQSPNKYTAEEANEGTSLAQIYSETRVRHWANLCEEIITSGLSGDDLICQKIESLLLANAE